MVFIRRLRNRIISRFRLSLLGGLLYQAFSTPPNRKICLVAATRFSESEFWAQAPLAPGLRHLRESADISIRLFFNNRQGLSSIYNAALRESEADHVVFLHDDVWINDEQLPEKVIESLRRFDITGVAGNVRRLPHQPAWLFLPSQGEAFLWDTAHLSGAVSHGSPGNSKLETYGPTHVRCELLDGVFLAVRRDKLLASRVFFDERFDFHFYDLDLCRSARRMGLTLGTWPIHLIHQSIGNFGSPDWHKGYQRYIQKWKE